MRRPTATTVSAARMNEPRSSSSSCNALKAASALARARRLAQARGSSPVRRRLVDVGRPQRVGFDAGLVEEAEPSRRTGRENEFGRADHAGFRRESARNLSEAIRPHNRRAGAPEHDHSGWLLPAISELPSLICPTERMMSSPSNCAKHA